MAGATSMEAKRVYKWDNAKFILIVLVVISHFTQFLKHVPLGKSIFYFCFLFHMPCFMFLSGLFSKSFMREDRDNAKKREKIIGYLMLYILLKVLIAQVRFLVSAGEIAFSFSLFRENGTPWYMIAMPAWLMLTYALRRVKPAVLIPLSILLACASGYDKDIGSFLSLNRITVFYPFFLLGFYLDPDKLLSILSKRIMRLISRVALIAIASYIYIYIEDIYPSYYLCNPRYDRTWLNIPDMYFSLRLIYYPVVCCVLFAFLSAVPSKKTFFTPLGQRTLQVYFWHMPIVYLIFDTPISQIIQGAFPNTYVQFYLLIAVWLSFFLSATVFGVPVNAIMNNHTDSADNVSPQVDTN